MAELNVRSKTPFVCIKYQLFDLEKRPAGKTNTCESCSGGITAKAGREDNEEQLPQSR